MEVDRVKVRVQYRQQLANGNYKTVDLEAAGTLSPKESWQAGQAFLYAELGRQMVELFKGADPKTEPARVEYRAADPVPGRAEPVNPLQQLAPEANAYHIAAGPPEPTELQHWCVHHAQRFTRHTAKTGGQSWYSHKVEGTDEWCRE